MSEDLHDAALHYHRNPSPGKVRVTATKPLSSQRDLSLAYSPGVAAACEEIVRDPGEAASITARANLVAVITNGTAVLGLGAIGPLAAKPVMEGKAVLFKKFAGIDAYDIEINETDPDKLVDTIAGLEPTFGAINLEDIRAPDCFIVEQKLRDRLSIPVFHDDQHGTAIVTGAAILNGLRLINKTLAQVKLVVCGAGAAAIACTNLLVALGIRKENVTMLDRLGVVYTGRVEEMDDQKSVYAIDTEARTLDEVIDGADIFLGLSVGGILKRDMVVRMAKDPLILALANPVPEIMPEQAKAARPDAIIATGRSDYPNQVNNVLCFPFIFRGALDVGASTINDQMKLACLRAIADIAMAPSSHVVASVYGEQDLTFGPEYLLPKPFDPRLITSVAPAVAKAAIDSGVATRPLEDFEHYKLKLSRVVIRSGTVMKPIFEAATQSPRKILYTEGEEGRVLWAIQELLDEGYAQPVLIGREHVVSEQIRKLGLRCKANIDFELIDPYQYSNYQQLAQHYHRLLGRKGVQPATAQTLVRTKTILLGSMLLRRNEVDALIAGPGPFHDNLPHILDVIGLRDGSTVVAGLQLLILDSGTYFITDTSVNDYPSAEQIVEITELAVEQVQRFGIEPKVALLSHSNFGSHETTDTFKLRQALELLVERHPDLEIDGEMQSGTALSPEERMRVLPDCRLKGISNLLVMPNLDAAHITFNALRSLSQGVSVGPILLGVRQPAYILNRNTTARGVVNLSAVAAVHVQAMGDI